MVAAHGLLGMANWIQSATLQQTFIHHRIHPMQEMMQMMIMILNITGDDVNDDDDDTSMH